MNDKGDKTMIGIVNVGEVRCPVCGENCVVHYTTRKEVYRHIRVLADYEVPRVHALCLEDMTAARTVDDALTTFRASIMLEYARAD